MKDMKDYFDKKTLLHQKSNSKINFIDSCFLTTNSIYQKAILGDENWFNPNGLNYMAGLAGDAYTTSEGQIRRYHSNFGKLIGANPKETLIYDNPNHVSRDNSLGMIMMMGHFGDRKFVRNFMLQTLLRGSFFQNTHTVKGEKKSFPDFAGPGSWSIMIRSGFSKPILVLLYPLLLLLDIGFMASYLFHVLLSKKDPTHTSTVFHMLSGLLLARQLPTPFSFIAEKVFLNFRSKVPGFDDEEPVVSALKYYSRSTYDPPIYELGARVVNHLRRG